MNLKNPRPGKNLNDKIAVVYSSAYEINLAGLEKLHAFDIKKYSKIYRQLLDDKLLTPEQVHVPAEITREEILTVQTEAFLKSLKSSSTIARYTEANVLAILPAATLEAGVLRKFRRASGGTLLAARQALDCGIAINIGGGYHHAKPEIGEGFCVYADVPIAIRVLQEEKKISRALVIDLDVHQGNGTAVCLADDPETFTFSIHQGDIYPLPKEESDLDVEVDAGTGDKEYIALLSKHLDPVIEKAKPDIVFYVAGCDTLEGDPLANLQMTPAGIVKRDTMVIEACAKRNIPVVMTLSGGYSKNAWGAQYLSIAHLIREHSGEQKEP